MWEAGGGTRRRVPGGADAGDGKQAAETGRRNQETGARWRGRRRREAGGRDWKTQTQRAGDQVREPNGEKRETGPEGRNQVAGSKKTGNGAERGCRDRKSAEREGEIGAL